MKIVNIGGAINSGKSTVAGILTEKLKNAVLLRSTICCLMRRLRCFPTFGRG